MNAAQEKALLRRAKFLRECIRLRQAIYVGDWSRVEIKVNGERILLLRQGTQDWVEELAWPEVIPRLRLMLAELANLLEKESEDPPQAGFLG